MSSCRKPLQEAAFLGNRSRACGHRCPLSCCWRLPRHLDAESREYLPPPGIFSLCRLGVHHDHTRAPPAPAAHRLAQPRPCVQTIPIQRRHPGLHSLQFGGPGLFSPALLRTSYTQAVPRSPRRRDRGGRV